MEIRDATPGDVSRIRAVHEASIRELGVDGYDAHQVDAWAAGCASAEYGSSVADPDEAFVVAVVDDRIVGFGSLRYEADEYPIDVDAEVTAVYVHPSVARQGVGTALLGELEERARDRGVERLVLTASRNAVPFYQHHGYTRHRSLEHEFSPDESTGVVGTVVEMVKPLGGRRSDSIATAP